MERDTTLWRRGGVGSYCTTLFSLATLSAAFHHVDDNHSVTVLTCLALSLTSYIVLRLHGNSRHLSGKRFKGDGDADKKDEDNKKLASAPPDEERGEYVWLILFTCVGLHQSWKLLHVSGASSLTLSAGDAVVMVTRVCTLLAAQLAIPRLLPRCFTPGEAAVCAHISEHCFHAAAANYYRNPPGFCTEFRGVRQAALASDEHVTYFIQVSVTSCLVVIGLANALPVFQRGWLFYALVFPFMGLVTYPVLNCYLEQDYVTWLYGYITSTPTRACLFWYWSTCFLIGGAYILFADPAVRRVVCEQAARFVPRRFQPRGTAAVAGRSGQTLLNPAELIVLRKQFHVLAVAVFLPGVALDVRITSVAIACAVQIFVMVESLRVFNIPPLGVSLNANLALFKDEKDEGAILLTPIYLLVGCGLPLLLLPYTAGAGAGAGAGLSLLSGVIAVGVGDSAASVVGSRYGRHRWPGTVKTVEGTLAAVTSQAAAALALRYLPTGGATAAAGFQAPLCNIAMASVVTSLLEAYTTQIDNVILPLCFFTFLNIPT